MTISGKAWHEAGHLAVMVGMGLIPTAPDQSWMPGAPWWAVPSLFDTRHLTTDCAKRPDALRNVMVRRPAILAYAGVVAEAMGTGRKLSAVLKEADGAADVAFVRHMLARYPGDDFGWLQREALECVEAIHGFDNHNLRPIASHPLTASEPWALGALVTPKGTLDLGFDMTECGMPFAGTFIPCGPNRMVVSAMLPGGTMGVQVAVHPTMDRKTIAELLKGQVQHYRPTLEAEYRAAI